MHFLNLTVSQAERVTSFASSQRGFFMELKTGGCNSAIPSPYTSVNTDKKSQELTNKTLYCAAYLGRYFGRQKELLGFRLIFILSLN